MLSDSIRALGKGEVESSSLSGSTIFSVYGRDIQSGGLAHDGAPWAAPDAAIIGARTAHSW